MSTGKELKKELVKIIYRNMGKRMADLFAQFYHEDNPDVLLGAAHDLLTELMGSKKAKLELQPLTSKYA